MNNFFNCDKVIYQTYECDRLELHPLWQQTSQRWIDMHPDWEYEFSSSEKRRFEIKSILNLSEFGSKAFDSYNGLDQSDLWKFIIASKNGGMYADLDSICTKNIDSLIATVDNKYELITGSFNFQVIQGVNASNFIFAKDSELGKELMNIVYEFLEISGFLLKKSMPSLEIKGMDMWCNFILLNKNKVADVLLGSKNRIDPGYYIHGASLKPDSMWRSKFENKKKLGIRTPYPDIYSDRWKSLWHDRNSDILSQ